MRPEAFRPSLAGRFEQGSLRVSQIALWGAVELGLVYAFVALGVYLAFRVLDFPDLTVDGTFPLGAAVTAVLIIAGFNPWRQNRLQHTIY